MAQNRIQFQPGMAMPELIAQYGTETQCAAARAQARWPHGFRCPGCGSAAHGVIQDDRAQRFQCKTCRHQTSLTAGTVMEATELALRT
jgi:transposase-like protein